MQKKSLFVRVREQKVLCLMIFPAVVFLLMFHYMPLFGLVMAFKDFNYADGIWKSPWTGLANFEYLFVMKNVTLRIIKNTVLYYVLFTALGTFCNIALALMLNECLSPRFTKYTHTIMILPTFISWIAITYIVKAFLGTTDGLFNNLLQKLGREPINWYMTAKYWPSILTIITLWKGTGYGCILYLSTLCGIDPSLYEAATIDGANKFQQTRYISLPMLLPLVSIMLLLSLGGIMTSNTGLFYRVTLNTGILYSTTQTIDAYVMNAIMGTNNANFNMTSAVTFFQSFVGLVMVVATNLVVRRIAPENALF